MSVRESQSVRNQSSRSCHARASTPCQSEQAVKAFVPYNSIKAENPEARAAGKALVAEGKAAGPKRRTFIYVNNRLEGNAISTIAAILEPE